ncbi:MAG: pyridoxine 5'-phosphate synthase [Verrucomicrobiae bacterium]|nr:pyridoxine 5'-phosphate synthase [Verrucomicrobiae bacterium]
MKLRLGVNVDHVATVRQARYREKVPGMIAEPDPVGFALEAQKAGAHGITAHLREDRRHMQEEDIRRLKREVALPLNLEMANTAEMVKFALALKPDAVCLVPENRQEVTTEGGLDVFGHRISLQKNIVRLRDVGAKVSLFIDPDLKQIEFAKKVGADWIELHTGKFAVVYQNKRRRAEELKRLIEGAHFANKMGLKVNAGHGLHVRNVCDLFVMPFLYELNIGHSIVSRALWVGVRNAVKEMLVLMKEYRL